MINLVEQLLTDHCGVGPVEPRFQSSGRLQCHLDTHLKQADWKAWSDLCRDPQPEIVINLRSFGEYIFQLTHVPNAKVAVLENDPSTREEGGIVLLSGNFLLAFTHRDLVRWEFLFLLREFINGQCGVTARCQQVKHRLAA